MILNAIALWHYMILNVIILWLYDTECFGTYYILILVTVWPLSTHSQLMWTTVSLPLHTSSGMLTDMAWILTE